VEKAQPATSKSDEKKTEVAHVDEEEEEEEEGSEFDEDDEMEDYSDEEELEEEEEEEEEEIDADDQSMHRANSDELMVVLVPSDDKLNDGQSKQEEEPVFGNFFRKWKYLNFCLFSISLFFQHNI